MVVKKQSVQGEGKPEARADTSTPDVHDGADVEPTSYRYIGGLDAVLVVVGDTSYDFRKNDPVHLANPVKGLDDNPDFERVEEAG